MKEYILLITGIYLLLLGMSMRTKNFVSFLIFKATPFLLGLASILIMVSTMGWI